MIRFVYFDAAGTLLMPHPSVGTIYARAGAPFGLSVGSAELEGEFRAVWAEYCRPDQGGAMSAIADEASTRAWWRGLVLRVLERVRFTGDHEAVFDACYRAFASSDAWRIFDDVRPALEGMRGQGLPMGVLSNWDPRLPALLEDLQLTQYFGTLVVSAIEGVEKPDRRIFEIAREKAGVEPSEILYVGDHPELDLEPARAYGMHAYLIDRVGRFRSPYVITSLTELLALT